MLSRLGGGVFDVEMDIEFESSTGLGKKKLVHELSFDGDGKKVEIFLEVDQDQDKNESIASSLAARFDLIMKDYE